VLDQVLGGQIPDPTNGADHFLNPALQSQLGRQQPQWAQQGGQRIGNHVFFRMGGNPQNTDPQGIASLTPQPQGDAAVAGGQGQDVVAPPGYHVLAQQQKQPAWVSDGKGNLINRDTGDRKVDPTSPGAGGSPTGNTALSGEPYLQTLPAARAAQVKAMLDGRMAFPTAFALKTPYWQSMIADAAQVDPTFDAVNFAARVKTRQDFTSGKNAQNIKALNTAIGHLGRLDSQIPGTSGLSGFPGATLVNQGVNMFNRSSGDPGVTNFDQTASALATELTAVFRGTGGAEADVKRYLDQLLGQ